MTGDRLVFGLNDVQAEAVNAIRSDYFDKLIGTHWETVDRIMDATGLLRPEADWLLCRNDPATAGLLPDEAFQ